MVAEPLAEVRSHRPLYHVSTEELLVELHERDLDTKEEIEGRFRRESMVASLPAYELEQLRQEWLDRARRNVKADVRAMPDTELAARIEAKRYLGSTFGVDALERRVLEFENRILADELKRRYEIRLADPDNPDIPPTPVRDNALRERIERMHQRFPIERFCEDLLGLHLVKRGAYLKATCPLPGHQDKTPSFYVFADTNRARCFGCNRGGDIFDLTMLIYSDQSIYDALRRLERAA